ncbi:MAG: hypothetical protein WCE79_11655 [Xanthobacteraceae bacterium]
MSQIDINPLFSGLSAGGMVAVTISGTVSEPHVACSDLEVTLSCPGSGSSGPAIVDGRTGDWTAKLTTNCECGTDLVTVVAGSVTLGCSSSSTGPIVCYVDWHKRGVAERMMEYRRRMLSHRQFLAITNFGSCYKCMTLSLGLFIVSLLVLSASAIKGLTIVCVIGLLATMAFGSLVCLHAIFFVLKRKKLVIPQPQQQYGRCCGS